MERQLWCAVIQTAWDDYFAPILTHDWLQELREQMIAKREAWLFLTKTVGEWAESREDVCNAAGIDPDALRERFLAENARVLRLAQAA